MGGGVGGGQGDRDRETGSGESGAGRGRNYPNGDDLFLPGVERGKMRSNLKKRRERRDSKRNFARREVWRINLRGGKEKGRASKQKIKGFAGEEK